MFESLFGAETPLAVRFFIAFVVVFGLIGVSAWLIRRFGSARLGGAARGRQPRLAVIEAGAVDGRRRLVLIRRDNVEHLLMIGGPSDIVVEQNIMRAQPARDVVRAPVAETPAGWPPLAPEPGTPRPRPSGLDEHWPAPPAEPVPPAVPSPAFTPAQTPAAPVARRPAAPRHAEPRHADPLAGLASELSHPAPAHTPARTAPSLDHARDVSRGREAPRVAPSLDTVRPGQPAPAPAAKDAGGDDQNLSEMAQRLEAALRRPAPAAAAATAPAAPASLASAPRIDSHNGARDKATAGEPAAASNDAALGSLEQEMANLLGRSSGKE